MIRNLSQLNIVAENIASALLREFLITVESDCSENTEIEPELQRHPHAILT